MLCTVCNKSENIVLKGKYYRFSLDFEIKIRKRKCCYCGNVFNTAEVVLNDKNVEIVRDALDSMLMFYPIENL
jgi:transcriptional regulator NrdR family protein